ncbi:MAG TPA: helix-turn-helix transcriptional regulator [Paludibacteraceae bacterium]|nr:helix-turn-helix transcriptional regulator [Paludibacteraceae bacterium]
MNNLKKIRIKKGLSINQVANELGVSRTFIARCESGEKVSLEKIQDYAHYLGCEFLPVILGSSYMTTFEEDKMIVDFGQGNTIVFDKSNRSLVRYDGDVVREVYDYEKYSSISNFTNLITSYLDV